MLESKIDLFVLISLLALACAKGTKAPSESDLTATPEELKRSYSSICEEFEFLTTFSVDHHIARTRADIPELRARAIRFLGEISSTSPGDSCADIEALLHVLQKKYADKEVNEIGVYQQVFKKFVGLLDPHSRYYPPKEAERYFSAAKDNQIGGIGVEFKYRLGEALRPTTDLVVEEVFPNSPADGRLDPGDRIITVNEKSIGKESYGDLMNVLDNSSTSISLRVNESHGDLVDLTPAKFQWRPVFWKPLDIDHGKSVGYIRIRQFTQGVSDLTAIALRTLESDSSTIGYIVDLRGNGGGNVSESAKLSDLFIDRGEVLKLLPNERKTYPKEIDDALKPTIYRAEHAGSQTRKPVVVLIDPNSASSSEIVAGTLGETRALVGGERSYGKGTSQSLIALPDNLRLTGLLMLDMYYFCLGDGFSPQKTGIEPHSGLEVINTAGHDVIDAARKDLKPEERIYLYESDYGDWALPSISKWRDRPFGSAVLSAAREIQSRRNEEHWSFECSFEKDCQLEAATKFLEVAAELFPLWPDKDQNLAQLDRSPATHYPSGL